MANVKELKARIEGVQETKKITNAMYLVASTKLRHAREALDRTRPYFDATRREVFRIFGSLKNSESRYFLSPDGSVPRGGVCGILVVTADKGLAGSYNMNAVRQAEAILKKSPDARLFVMGEYGRRYFRMHRIPTEQDFLYTAQNPTLNRARDICTRLLSLYEQAALNEIILVYTDMTNSLSATTQQQRLLPVQRNTSIDNSDFDLFIPSPDEVLGAIMRSYLSGFIYSALVNSFCCEQNARVTAMESAGQSANDLLDNLSRQLNRERQSAITQEIIEISAGAKAIKKK